MRAVRVVAPEGVDDPLRPSGGNTYDRRLCARLAATGWSVDLRQVRGDWPWADAVARRDLADVLAAAPDGSVVLVDGLVALAAPEVLVPSGLRLRIVVLVHMPISTDSGSAREREAAVLRSAAGVVTTSDWTRRWLLAQHGLDPGRVQVATPGVDPAPTVAGSPEGGGLLCVGAVTRAKGHDLLVAALARVADRSWRCVCVGSLDRDPAYVTTLRECLRATRLADRVELRGPLTGSRLDAAYAAADVLVHASRAETYGMVVTEALARGLPVVATDAGGVSQALGVAPDGQRPGMLTPVGSAPALAGSLRSWLSDPDVRRRLRRAALMRREGLAGWDQTGDRVARVLEEVAA